MTPMIKIKRIYDHPASSDGTRILVDRLWPRGIRKEEAKVDLWLKEIAPSGGLRKRFAHDPEKWEELKSRYRKALDFKKEELGQLIEKARRGSITLLYGAKDETHNNAVVLQEYLDTQIKRRG
jgi:uncharacterized protein YeaO (DUF488 family)